jgi:hypothetical protein
VCADDYAHSSETSATIVELIQTGVVNATTCLVESASWPQDGKRLRERARGGRMFAVGLHLNLTEKMGRSRRRPIPLGRLALDPSASLEAELLERFLEQWDLFTQTFGGQPHFIDGHQHVHLAPAPRAALFRLIDEVAFTGWVRQCRTSSSRAASKRLILDHLSDAFCASARAHRVPCNPGFGGLRRFRTDENLLALWTRDLAGMSRGGVLIVHPGADKSGDAIGPCRAQEARSLPALCSVLSEHGFEQGWDSRLGW